MRCVDTCIFAFSSQRPPPVPHTLVVRAYVARAAEDLPLRLPAAADAPAELDAGPEVTVEGNVEVPVEVNVEVNAEVNVEMYKCLWK